MYNLYLDDRFETQLNLQSDGVSVVDYAFRSGTPSGRHGEVMPDDSVSETIVLAIEGASQAAVQDIVRKLERFLDRARLNHGRRVNDAVYLYGQLDDDVWPWRTEILGGEISSINPLRDLWQNRVDVSVAITRRPFWEKDYLTQVMLTSTANPSPWTTVGITNNTQNWVQIDAGQVPGSMPAPIYISVENTEVGQTRYLTGQWVINNAHVAPTTVDMYMEGSETTVASGSLAGSFSTLRWLLPDSLVHNAAGRYVRMLLFMSSVPTTARVKGGIDIGISGGSTFVESWIGREYEIDRQVMDLGVFPVPPGGASNAFQQVYFKVKFDNSPNSLSPGSVTRLQMVPVSSEKRWDMLGGFSSLGLEVGEKAVDDGIQGDAYVLQGSNKYPILLPRGGPLLVYPNLTQRLVISWAGFSGVYQAYDSDVRVYVRPRRATI